MTRTTVTALFIVTVSAIGGLLGACIAQALGLQ